MGIISLYRDTYSVLRDNGNHGPELKLRAFLSWKMPPGKADGFMLRCSSLGVSSPRVRSGYSFERPGLCKSSRVPPRLAAVRRPGSKGMVSKETALARSLCVPSWLSVLVVQKPAACSFIKGVPALCGSPPARGCWPRWRRPVSRSLLRYRRSGSPSTRGPSSHRSPGRRRSRSSGVHSR